VPVPPAYSSTAREQAREILSKAPFKTSPEHTPRPLAGVLHALGRVLDALVGRPARWIYHHLLLDVGHGFRTTFGGWWPIAAGALCVGAGVLLGVALARRRSRPAGGDHRRALPAAAEDADDLDARAASAEDAGDHEAAVRLRFRSGLVRLSQRDVLTDHWALTDRQLSSRLRSATFDVLAGRHEAIVYGREPATAVDAEEARRGWPRVLAEVPSGTAPS
jgi:hypothetical protein